MWWKTYCHQAIRWHKVMQSYNIIMLAITLAERWPETEVRNGGWILDYNGEIFQFASYSWQSSKWWMNESKWSSTNIMNGGDPFVEFRRYALGLNDSFVWSAAINDWYRLCVCVCVCHSLYIMDLNQSIGSENSELREGVIKVRSYRWLHTTVLPMLLK